MTSPSRPEQPRNGFTITNRAPVMPAPIRHHGHTHWTWGEASRCLFTSHPSTHKQWRADR